MKKLDPNRYYKLVSLGERDAWAQRTASDSILGAILRPTLGRIHTPRDRDRWMGSFDIIQRSQWGHPSISPITLLNAKLHLVPHNQQEKIDESRLNATAARS